MGAERAGGPIASVQVLRALAALTVVFGHAQHDALITAGRAGLDFARNHALPWGAGVDLFFVISGFIMVHASERLFGRPGAAVEFLRRRIARIVPLYWLLATAYLILSQNFGGLAEKPPLSTAGVLASYLFWPFDLFGDGVPRPFYTLGWTLNYEMFFYVLFAGALFLPRGPAVAAVTALLAGGVALGAWLAPLPTAPAFWAMPIVLEFALGMGLALLARHGIRLPVWGVAAALLGALAVLVADPMGAATKPAAWITPNDWVRLVCWGLPAALILAACVLAPPGALPAVRGAVGRFWVRLGDASYALYLVHPFVLVAGRKLWLALGLHASLGLWPMVALLVAGSVVAAFAVYHLFEKPLTAYLTRRAPAQPSRPSAGNASSR